MPYNKKIAVVYKSKYGCTLKYAGWMALKLGADLYEVEDVGMWDLLKYKTIIFGSPIYNGKIYLNKFISQKYKSIRNKNIMLFIVNLDLQNKEQLINYNFDNEELKEKIKFFFLEGSIDYDNLSKIDRIRFEKSIKKEESFNLVGLENSINLDKQHKRQINSIIEYAYKRTY